MGAPACNRWPGEQKTSTNVPLMGVGQQRIRLVSELKRTNRQQIPVVTQLSKMLPCRRRNRQEMTGLRASRRPLRARPQHLAELAG